MTKLKYIGKQELPSSLSHIDGRLWTILTTEEKSVRPYLDSTRTLEGLQQLGIVPGAVLDIQEEPEITLEDLESQYNLFCIYAKEDVYRKCLFSTIKFSLVRS